MAILDTQLREYEQLARDAIVGLASQVTVRSAPIADTKNNTSQLDVRFIVLSEEGSRNTKSKATVEMRLYCAGRSDNPEDATNIAEWTLQTAIDRITNVSALTGILSNNKVYERDPIAGGGEGGSWVYVVRVSVEGTTMVAGRTGPAIGLNIASQGIHPRGNAHSVELAKVVEIQTLSQQIAPASISVFYANLEINDVIELVDDDDIVAGSFTVTVPGFGTHTFLSIASGTYRARVEDYTSNMTAVVLPPLTL